jgi:hypothetical protein
MLKTLMAKYNCDAPWVIEKISNDMCEQYRSIINKFDMSGDKLINFFRKHNEAYKQVTDEFISWNY